MPLSVTAVGNKQADNYERQAKQEKQRRSDRDRARYHHPWGIIVWMLRLVTARVEDDVANDDDWPQQGGGK
jgi:hypothetical protein